MLNIPALEFKESNSYINKQLSNLDTNKKLLLNIISYLQTNNNITLLNSSNEQLNNINQNIDKLNNLNSGISNINNRLSNLVSENIFEDKNYYIDKLTTIKKEVENYFEEFKEIEQKLITDNKIFDEFISTNNLFSININENINDDIDDNINENVNENINDTSDISNNIEEKIETIKNASSDNDILIISEKLQKVYLPYKISDLKIYMEKNPELYKSLEEVVEKEYSLPFNFFSRRPSKSRFSATYNLLRNQGNNFIKSVSYAFKLLGKRDLNPAIIVSCKTKEILENYLYCLETNNLENFKYFKIIYDINPLP